MDILITGNVFYLTQSLTELLVSAKHKVVIASKKLPEFKLKKNRNFAIHSIDPDEDLFVETFSSYKFDTIIFLPNHEEHILPFEKNKYYAKHLLSGLKNALELAQKGNAKQFIYVSSTEVYGEANFDDEITIPEPTSLNGYALYAGEQFCKYFEHHNQLRIHILRVPFLYSAHDTDSLLFSLVRQGIEKGEIVLPEKPDHSYNFLHSEDLSRFIYQVMQEEQSLGDSIINLSSITTLTEQELIDLLTQQIPDVKITKTNQEILLTRTVAIDRAKAIYDWVDLHDIKKEFESLVAQYQTLILEKKAGSGENRFSAFLDFLKWIELILGAVVMQLLTQYTGTLIQFKYVDFRLLFVVIMSSVYGLQFGVLSAILASLSVLYTWFQLGFNWTLISNNVGNWFPFFIYFGTGLLLGYYHDKQVREIEYEKNQTQLIYGKFEFLYSIFNEISSLKDEFQQKLVGYRDSFGKIFSITQELDSLEEDMIYLNAINILQEFLENESIAIYAIGKKMNYARLEACSPKLIGKISKSIHLPDLPDIKENLEQGIVFHNKELKANYPAYLAPLMNNGKTAAFVTIWDANYEQHSLYYYNLFKVISGLIQASIVRATLFASANTSSIYYPDTKILKPQAFRDALKIKIQMKNNQISDHQILRFNVNGKSVEDLYASLVDKVRSEDLISLDPQDNCYIVLSQVNQESIGDIVKRFDLLDVDYQTIPDSAFLS
jgi:UDP-glucose 4-epimerase